MAAEEWMQGVKTFHCLLSEGEEEERGNVQVRLIRAVQSSWSNNV